MRSSADGGATWSDIKLPAGGAGLAVDSANASVMVTGGAKIQVSLDGGITWKATRSTPPGAGPFTPAMVSAADSNVWLVYGNGNLMRTRDAGISWRVVTGLPAVTAPHLAEMAPPGLFAMALGDRVFELVDNGTSVKQLPALPAGGNITELAVVSSGDPPDLVAVTDTGNTDRLHAGTWQDVAGGLAGPLAGLPNGRVWLGDGGQRLGTPGSLSISFDGGLNGTPATGLPVDQSVDAVGAVGPAGDSVWAYCAAGDLYHSTDGGRTWTVASKALRSAPGG